MAIDVEESLTRKLGPLPTWMWGIVVAGGVLVAKRVGIGRGGGGGTPTVINQPVTTPPDPSNGPSSADDAALVGQVNDLATQLAKLTTDQQTSTDTFTQQLASLANTVSSTASSETLTKIRDLMVQLNNALFQREQHLHNFDFAKAQAYNNYRAYMDAGGTGGGKVGSNVSSTNRTAALKDYAEFQRLQGVATTESGLVDGINKQIADLQAQLQAA